VAGACLVIWAIWLSVKLLFSSTAAADGCEGSMIGMRLSADFVNECVCAGPSTVTLNLLPATFLTITIGAPWP
jgi:hypothetical protein